MWILRALLSTGKPKRLQGLHSLGVTKVSTWVQVLQAEKRMQGSCVVESHERKGSEEEEGCRHLEIRQKQR